jgi:predicted dehydrogenase
MLKAAITAGLHAVSEKPWLYSKAESESLLALAGERGSLLAVHYQYCLLDAVERWRRDFNQGAGLCFGGRFTLGRADRLGIPALRNLGSHLLAIRAYAASLASVSEIQCGYDQPDQREIWLEAGSQQISSICFFPTKEPIIQRFIRRLEPALDKLEFPFDLRFAARVADDIAAYERRKTAGKLK